MHVLLVSACEKRAIKKTNAIIDSYAVRVGDRTWATPITIEALAELHAALRRVATRQTAVACFQNDGRRRMQPLWIVGSRSAFGPDGQIPVGTTRTRHARQAVAAPLWVRCICLLAQAAGLGHDLGKYSCYFQAKLRSNVCQRDAIRHEWLSVQLLQTMRAEQHWEQAWRFNTASVHDLVLGQRCFSTGSPHTPACAQEAIDYLIATHHLLFADGISSFSTASSSIPPTAAPSVKQSHVRIEKGQPIAPALRSPHSPLASGLFEDYAKLEHKLAQLTQGQQGSEHTQFWWGTLVYARAALIFADHSVSACVRDVANAADACANTCGDANGQRRLNQRLDWHLRTVAEVAAHAAWRMAQLCQQDSDRTSQLEGLQEQALAEVLAPANENSRFQWQNRAASALAAAREQHPDVPCLVFNMAGTGSGKTRMNVRAACIVSRSASPRCSIALNLRSLTLQTGAALRNSLKLSPSDLATLIGDSTVQKLFDNTAAAFADDDENMPEADFMCEGELAPLPAWMEPFFRTQQERTLMGVPLLVSTIDFLCAAGSPHTQGHHVKALLRLMSADLVLDEIDGYEPEALVAVLRLVQLCALFQRNVLCSSATLSEPTAVAIDTAYRSGISMRCSLVGEGADPHFIRAIIDDALPPQSDMYSCEDTHFQASYTQRLEQLAQHLQTAPCLRRAYLQRVEESREGFLQAIGQAVEQLHGRTKALYGGNKGDTQSTISFGLVRVATIGGAIDVARYVARTFPHARVACYHSGDWLISRFHKERRLDALLSRQHGDTHILQDAEIRELTANAPDVPFIVVASPVEEIGRDHDFDWAIIEPSSAQSIVQVAGRVNRHRLIALQQGCNIALLQYNLRHCGNIDDGKDTHIAFAQPGYEQAYNRAAYGEHNLHDLLPWPSGQQELVINAALRFDPTCKLARADDTAIQRRTAQYFGHNREYGAGMFMRKPQPGVLMSARPYQDTPLREQSLPKQLWRMQVEAGCPSYSRLEEVQAERFSKQMWVSNNREMRTTEAATNAWLHLTPDAMLALCHIMGITAENGLLAELHSYGTDPTFEHDLAFGIRRLK